jgi:MacB-like periplasmic core domain
MIDGIWDDTRYAFRNLRRDPFLAFAATLTLAVCIGANTTVFSVANSILIRPLPYPGSERIDWISERSGPARQDVGAAPDYFALREQNRIFEDVAAFDPMTVNWTGVERPEQLEAADVSPSFFRVMGSQPMLGRYFGTEEEGPKAPPVAVLSYAFWRNRLGSDPHILGKNDCARALAAHDCRRYAARVRLSPWHSALGANRAGQSDRRFSDRAHTRGFRNANHRPAKAGCNAAGSRDGDESPHFIDSRSVPQGIPANRFSDGPHHRHFPSARASHGTGASRVIDPHRHRRPCVADRLRESCQFVIGTRR